MDNSKNKFGLGLTDSGTQIDPSATESIIEQQSCLMKVIDPPTAITAMLTQEEGMRAIFDPPMALTAMVEQANHMRSIVSVPMIEALNAQQDCFANYKFAFSKNITATILPQISLISDSIAKTVSLSFQENTYSLATAMGRALESCIPKYDLMTNALATALKSSMPKFDAIGAMALRLTDSIPRIDAAITTIAQQALEAMGNITESLQSGVSALLGSLTDIRLPNFDNIANSLNFITGFEEKNELLKSFGWYLISELPEEIVDEIYERRDEIAQEEVDALIIKHFRDNKCQALKCIVKSWTALPYFESRKVVFHEAQVCHSRRSYNASTTLISLHYEGVVTDFVRDRVNTPTYRVEKALKCINDLANDLNLSAMSFKDWIVCSYVLECVDQAFTTNFSPSDPDSCPNNSRHKIAHGHATAKETEANSLRRFLFMNELYKLFCCLEHEYQLAS